MNPWRPYLLEVLGEGKHGRERVDEAATLIQSLLSRRLTAKDLLGLVDWLEELDAFRQVFILPTVLDLLADPSRSLRSRILRFAGELIGASFESLLTEVEKMTEADRDAAKQLHRVLDAVAAIPQPPLDDGSAADDLATLLTDRPAIFAVSLLGGIHAWLESRPDAEQLRRVYSDFFGKDEQSPVRTAMLELLTDGPLFVRHLIARWLGRTGINLSADLGARQLLFGRYGDEPAAVVAATAVEAYAELTEAAEVAATTQRLEAELRTGSERRARFGGSPVIGHAEAARCLSSAVLRAIGTLARRHPSQPAPRAALRRVVSARPTSLVDLFHSESKEARASVFETALALFGERLRLKIVDVHRENGVIVGDIGVRELQVVEEPDRSIDRSAKAYWCELASGDAGRRRFRLVEPCRGRSLTTSDLLGLITPRIDAMATWRSPRRSIAALRDRCDREIAERATWSGVAVEVVAAALLASKQAAKTDSTDDDADTSAGDLDALLTFLVQTAEAAEQVIYAENRIGSDGIELRNRTRRLLLNDFANEEFFARLFAEGEADEVRARLLTALATAAMRSLDDEVSYRWINGNLELLRGVAGNAGYPLRDRAAAAAAVHLRIKTLEEEDGLPIVIEGAVDTKRADGRRALPFVTDAVLHEIYDRLDRRADRQLLRSRPEDVHDRVEQLAVRSEIVARALERADESAVDIDDEIGICLAAAVSTQRDVLLPDGARRRLTAAFVAAPPARRTKLVRRLFEQLLRTASSAQLVAVLRLAQRGGKPAMEQYLGLLMERRLEDEPDAPRDVGGRRFDVQTIVDVAARRTVPLTYLRRLADRNLDFVRDFLHRRGDRLRRRETDRVVATTGSVRRIAGVPDDRLPVELRPIGPGSPGPNVAATAVDLVPSFVHHPRGQTDVRCLTMLRRTPPKTVDLHLATLPMARRRELLDELLANGEPVLMAARVTSEGTDHRRLVDFGVSPAGLPVRVDLPLDRETEPDDVVVVRMRRETGRKLVIISGRFRLAEESPDEATDLRLQPGAIEWLEERSAQVTRLRCTVVNLLERNDGTVRCFCEAGFRLHDGKYPFGRHPSFVVGAAAAPPAHAEVVIEAAGLSFERIDAPEARDTVALLAAGSGLQEGQRVSGYLRREPAGGERHRWFADVGGVRLEVLRGHLTRDLRRLFELDALADDAPFLARLGKQLTNLTVLREATHASVVDGEPSWTIDDLMVAVAGGAVEDITVVGVDDQAPRGMVVEVASATPMTEELGDGPVVSVGTLAYVLQGDLFDQRGEPVAIDALAAGTRLSLAVWERSGEPPRGADKRPQPPIHLRLAEEPDVENRRLETMLAESDVVKVRVAGDGSKQLAEALLGLPPARVELASA
ncbi:MAG TPA: hypothetical protein VFS60_01980, partial [Thermoanaerobaculia bacterium]|nr:hypothetical protein [Thermoanaerobaculia bacterium]